MLEIGTVAISILAAVLPWALAQRYGLVKYASPMHFVAYFTFFGFTLKSIVYAANPNLAFYYDWLVRDDDVLYGYLYLYTFITMIALGYLASVRSTDCYEVSVTERLFCSLRAPEVLFTLSVISIVLTSILYLYVRDDIVDASVDVVDVLHGLNSRKSAVLDPSMDFGQSNASIKIFFVIPTVIFCLLMFQWIFLKAPRARFYCIASGLLMFAAAFIQGKRSDLLDLVIVGVSVWGVARKRFTARAILAVFLVTPLILSAFSVMSVLRSTRGSVADADLVSVEPLNQIVSSTYFLDINAPILISAKTIPSQMLWGSSYFSWTYAWIPRFVWPEKPIVALGTYFKSEIMGLAGTRGGFNPTGAGEAFINFGWYGVFIGFCLGFIFRMLERRMLSEDTMRSLFGPVAFCVCLTNFIQGALQSSFSASLVAFFSQLFLVWLVCKAMVRRPL